MPKTAEIVEITVSELQIGDMIKHSHMRTTQVKEIDFCSKSGWVHINKRDCYYLAAPIEVLR